MLAVDLGDLDDRDVERAAAEVVHRDLAVAALLVHAVGQRGRGRLVDDALDFEAGDLAGVLRRLALRVVEVGRDGDDRLGDRLAQVILGRLLHLHEHARGNLRRRHLLAVRLDPGVAVVGLDDLVRDHLEVAFDDVVAESPPDQALDREQRVARVRHRLPLGGLADEHFVVLGERHDRRRRAIALAVLDDLRLVAVHHGDARVGRAEVDTDHSSH